MNDSGFVKSWLMCLLIVAGFAASLVEAGQVPDEWQNQHCPGAVLDSNIQNSSYVARAKRFAMRAEHEKMEEVQSQYHRYSMCGVFIFQNSANPLSAYRSKEYLIDSGAPPETIRLHSLETILGKSKRIVGDSDRINEVVEEMYRTAYTEEYAHMGDREAMRKLTERYFCECLNIPVEEFADL